MTLFWIIGALVFGLCMFLMVRRSWKRAERLDSFKDKYAPCPTVGCYQQPEGKPSYVTNLVEVGVWKRDGLRGSLFDCATCGQESWWDMDRNPPVLREQGRQREPRKPRRDRK